VTSRRKRSQSAAGTGHTRRATSRETVRTGSATGPGCSSAGRRLLPRQAASRRGGDAHGTRARMATDGRNVVRRSGRSAPDDRRLHSREPLNTSCMVLLVLCGPPSKCAPIRQIGLRQDPVSLRFVCSAESRVPGATGDGDLALPAQHLLSGRHRRRRPAARSSDGQCSVGAPPARTRPPDRRCWPPARHGRGTSRRHARPGGRPRRGQRGRDAASRQVVARPLRQAARHRTAGHRLRHRPGRGRDGAGSPELWAAAPHFGWTHDRATAPSADCGNSCHPAVTCQASARQPIRESPHGQKECDEREQRPDEVEHGPQAAW
jgi:hypothetical protein